MSVYRFFYGEMVTGSEYFNINLHNIVQLLNCGHIRIQGYVSNGFWSPLFFFPFFKVKTFPKLSHFTHNS